MENDDAEKKELNDFQIRNISILTHLYSHDAITDDIVEEMRKNELEYFSLLDKYRLLESKINLDEKTNLLKFKKDYLSKIIKTASRIYHGIKSVKYPVSLIRFDIDDFSVFNNRYGHELGDTVLVKFANLMRDNSRPTDYIIRFGGEEFDVLLPSTELAGVKTYLEKIFKKLQGIELSFRKEKLKVTVSAGVASFEYNFDGNMEIHEQELNEQYYKLQTMADNALFEAKYLGKNRYCIYQPDKEEEYAKIRKFYVKLKE